MSDDPEYEDYLIECGSFKHEPMPPHPRPNHIGEFVYSEEWSTLMQERPPYGLDSPNSMLANVLWNLPARVTQRHATICATVICWLGTNCGRSVVDKALEYREKRIHHERQAYLIAWTIQNDRSPHVNHGIRILKHLLAPPECYGTPLLGVLPGPQVVRRPELSAEDYEVVEHLMLWLTEGIGATFVSRCRKRIEEMEHFERQRRRAEHDARVRRAFATVEKGAK